jgi:hypothetical protein
LSSLLVFTISLCWESIPAYQTSLTVYAADILPQESVAAGSLLSNFSTWTSLKIGMS